jgi:hypothetical protein
VLCRCVIAWAIEQGLHTSRSPATKITACRRPFPLSISEAGGIDPHARMLQGERGLHRIGVGVRDSSPRTNFALCYRTALSALRDLLEARRGPCVCARTLCARLVAIS